MKVYLDWVLKIITFFGYCFLLYLLFEISLFYINSNYLTLNFLGWVILVFTTAMVIFRIKDSLKENTLKEKFYNFINVV
jgi:hypothetical protein